MVEFFAPWCPACVTFLPVLEDIDQTLTYENENLAVYKVDFPEDNININIFCKYSLERLIQMKTRI